MTSFLIAYINLQIPFITLAFWYRFTNREFSNTSVCLRKVLRLMLDLRLGFPEMMIKGFVLRVQFLDQTAHPHGDPDLQNAGSGPTPVIPLGDPWTSIYPSLPAINLPLSIGQGSFLSSLPKSFYLVCCIWN